MLDAARDGGATEVKAAGDFLKAAWGAAISNLIEEMQPKYNRMLTRQEAYDFIGKDPKLETRVKLFRDLLLELEAIAKAKGLTVEGKRIPLTINSEGVVEKGDVKCSTPPARAGAVRLGSLGVPDALREASLPILIEELQPRVSQKITLEDARYHYNDDPNLEVRISLFATVPEVGLHYQGEGNDQGGQGD